MITVAVIILAAGLVMAGVGFWMVGRRRASQDQDFLGVPVAEDVQRLAGRMAREGRRADAVAFVRQRTCLELLPATRVVDDLAAGKRLPATIGQVVSTLIHRHPDLAAEIAPLKRQGNDVAAIRLLRSRVRIGVVEARDLVRALHE